MAWSAQEFAEAMGGFRRELAGIARRMQISRSGTGIWQTLGHLLLDGIKRETREVENYPGIGISARPPDGGSAECVVVQVGGPNNPAIVGARDEGTRAKVGDIAPDETTTYNSLARVYIKADGTIEARTHGGTAVSLATKADVGAVGLAISGALVVANDGGASLKATILAGQASSLHGAAGTTVWPVGTAKLKAE